ncbi:hypothetical protein ACWA2C_16635 [Priestia megaterium]
MTLVTAIATPYFISFVGDGRGVSTIDGTVLAENLDKICRINDKIVIATAGNRSFNEHYIPRIIANTNNEYDLSDADSFAQSLFEVIGYNKTGYDYRLLVGGLNKDGDICFTSINSPSLIKPEASVLNKFGQRGSVTNTTPYTSSMNPDDILSKRLSEATPTRDDYVNFNPEKAFAIQKQFNYDISQVDKTVNNNLTRDIIFSKKSLLIPNQ